MSKNEIKQTIFRLAHFDPTCRDEYGNQVIDYLVLDSLAAYGQLKVTASEIKDNIKKCFRLDFEEPEINASGKRLEQKQMITYEEGAKTEKPTFQILPEVEQKITSNLAEIKELENEVIDDWKKELYNKYKDYPIVKEKIEHIVDNLKLFTSRMFIRHGVESVALLYPEKQKAQQWLERIKTDVLESLPKIEYFTDAVIKLEIPSFFKKSDSKRKIYITSLFNSSFFWHLVQVDEKCSRLLREVTKGQRIYLDNNILYSLVGLDGINMFKSVHSMLKLAKALGYELWITTKSVDEFHESLNWRMKELKKLPLPAELARIAVENLDEDSFLTLYWREFIRNGTSIEEFIAEKSHIENILQGLEIQTTNEFRDEIEGSQELIEEKRILRSICTDGTSEYIIEHDAFHRIFINRIRGGTKRHFSEAVAWFLTNDSKLPAYDRVARKGKSYLAFCITSDQWVQINRPLLTRTTNQEEYEESFHILVTQPFLRSMMPTFSMAKAYNEVLGRLARYKDMNPQFAFNLAADKHFMFAAASEIDEKSLEEKVENKFVDMANQLQSQKEALEKDVKNKEGTIGRLENRISTIEEKVAETETKYQKQNVELEKSFGQIEEFGKILKESAIKREAAEKEADDIKEKFKGFKTKLVRWGIFAGALLLMSLYLWVHQYFVSWSLLAMHKNSLFIKLASNLLLLFGLLNIPLKQHWKVWVPLMGVMVALIITIACK